MTVSYRSILLGVALLSAAGCNLLSHSEPAAPVPTGVRWQLSGKIIHVGEGPIAGARLTVLDGSDQGTQSASDSAGQYAFPSLASGRFHMAIEAPGFDSVFPVVDLSRDTDVDFALFRTGAR